MKNIPFKQFINCFNFRTFTNNDVSIMNQDTTLIRIYLPYSDSINSDKEWFEFGMYDFWDKSKDKIRLLEKIFSKNILNCYVADIRYNDDNSTIYIYLSEKQEGDY